MPLDLSPSPSVPQLNRRVSKPCPSRLYGITDPTLDSVLTMERDRLVNADMASSRVVPYYDVIMLDFFGPDAPISEVLRVESQAAFARHRYDVHDNSTTHITRAIAHLARAAHRALFPTSDERTRRGELLLGNRILSTEALLFECAGIVPDRIEHPDLTVVDIAHFLDAIDRGAGVSAHAWRYAVLALNIPAPTQALMNVQWKHLCGPSRTFAVPHLLPGLGGMRMAPMALTDQLLRWAEIWQADRQDPEGYVLTGATTKASDRQDSLRPLMRRYSERLGIKHLGVRSFSTFCQMNLHTALYQTAPRGGTLWLSTRPDPALASLAAIRVLNDIMPHLERPYFPDADEAETRIAWTAITAEELKSLVWSEPTQQLKERFGVSDVAIAKKCRKFGIDKPPRGYWNKVSAGLDVRDLLKKHGIANLTANGG